MQQFDSLISEIKGLHSVMEQSAAKAINRHITVRNWLIGFYIIEFEQKGSNRATYGDRLLEVLAEKLATNGLSFRNLKLFRQFYLAYPQIGQTVSAQLQYFDVQPFIKNLPSGGTISDNALAPIDNIISTTDQVDSNTLISKLSFSHFSLLLPLRNVESRAFYESECIKGNWSVSELKRQINTLYYERSGLSIDKQKLRLHANETSEKTNMADLIKSPFTFEFLGLKAKDVVYENDLQQALIDNLEEFLIELGHGFCFEAKQKRITIGGEYFFIDLVFYHRILKCHVLVELKTKEAKHEHIGQLKTYINYYKKEIAQPSDNPPVGLLLVTDQNKALIEYAVADSDMPLFVSKYIVELPTKEELEIFINKELAQL
ncbi:PDDEXK nuclease domain-containing protein [Dyadobacter chenhuakuii]|uniref:PDDEXK nuclease domain-containing protein n=1 Tax=Dyadobacter chenhuakuii TaxID=2909339 RepID=A0A9X1QIG8_9BACT|nr:PDDEXK nuclease domain-containing protein [Dyadobacter chenhuakuii]MCF2501434.1 PDDEXK nuclease domain-containing protein [Dyadobacter chenhuakuii]